MPGGAIALQPPMKMTTTPTGRTGRRAGGKLGRTMADTDPDCIFCKIVAGELPSHGVDEDERTVAFMDINPATRGHALVIPRAPREGPARDRPRGSAGVSHAAQRLAQRVSARLGADGVNLINSCGAAAWQTVFHFHLHVIPRYKGDPLELPWVPRRATWTRSRRPRSCCAAEPLPDR